MLVCYCLCVNWKPQFCEIDAQKLYDCFVCGDGQTAMTKTTWKRDGIESCELVWSFDIFLRWLFALLRHSTNSTSFQTSGVHADWLRSVVGEPIESKQLSLSGNFALANSCHARSYAYSVPSFNRAPLISDFCYQGINWLFRRVQYILKFQSKPPIWPFPQVLKENPHGCARAEVFNR